MSVVDLWERLAADPLNRDGAASFGAPVLRCLNDDLILVGYSIWSHNGSATSVETHQMVRSSAESTPSAVSIVTRMADRRPSMSSEHGWYQHAATYISNFEHGPRAVVADRGAHHRHLDERLRGLKREEITVRIDEEIFTGMAISSGDFHIVLVERLESGHYWTIAGPTAIVVASPYSTELPG